MSTLILRPNAASSTAQARQGGVNYNYEAIDETTLDETDYCTVGGAPSRVLSDIYGFPDHSAEDGTINSVTVKCYCKQIVTGTCENNVTVRAVIQINSTEYLGSYNNLTLSTALYSHSWATNPATSSAWSWTNIDDLLVGDELTSYFIDKNNFVSSFCYQLWVEVDYGEAAAGSLPLKNVFGRPFSGVFR